MLIEKIKQVYKKKSVDEKIIQELKNGIDVMFYYYEPGIIVKLNQAIDWKHSKLPSGSAFELMEGDTFLFEGRPQIISLVDEDTIKLITSETGPYALDRIVKEIINPELKMVFSDTSNIQVDWEVLADGDFIDPSCSESSTIPYELYRIIKNRLFPGRENVINPDNYIIKVFAVGNSIPFLSEFYLDKSRIYYDPDFYEEDMMEYVIKDILSWMYKNIQVLGRPEFNTEKIEREAKELQENLEKMLNNYGPLNQGNQSQGCSGNCNSCSNPCTNPNKTFNNP